jgi:Cu/Ag efflux pump CusA
MTTVEELADTRIAQKISQLSGVGLVSLSGGQRPAVRVQANLQKLAALGLNIDDLRTTIANNNSNAPKGSFDGSMQSYTINANDQLQDAEAYQNIVVAYKNGSPVFLRDVQLGQQDSRGPDQRPAPAGRQRDCRGGFHQGAVAPDSGGVAAVGRCANAHRSHRNHPRLGRRR